MRKKIIAGNWKMNGTITFVGDLLSQLQANSQVSGLNKVEMIVFPPYVFLEQTQQILEGSPIKWGAQNVYSAPNGAYTGEISASMLKEFGCQYVIVGHSERRQLMYENSEQVAAKFIFAGKNGLKPVLCVGETREERAIGRTEEVISMQLTPVLNNAEGLKILSDAVIAYEPVWAIGTGLTATPEQAQEVHQFIRAQLASYDKLLAEKVRILYGGSVKQNNASGLFAMPDIDGGLIGGASLHAQEFLEITKLCNYC